MFVYCNPFEITHETLQQDSQSNKGDINGGKFKSGEKIPAEPE